MALLNFSVPYAPTASPAGPFLAAAASASAIGSLNAAAAVNSLIYGANHQHQPPNPPPYAHGTVPPPAPNRRTATSSRRLPPNEPYHHHHQQQQQQQTQQRSPRYYKEENHGGRITNTQASAKNSKEGHYPSRPSGYTRIDTNTNESNQPGSKTSLHAILDYDDDFDDYNYDDEEEDVIAELGHLPPVTPIQGPIYVKNGSVPVVPLYSYPVLNNGTFVQIPILWTALSLALGLEIRGEIIRGVPCIKRFHQLFCPTAGNSYPIDQIERFIDENKALMKRMYGEFQMSEDFGSPPGVQQGKRNSKRDTAADGGETTTTSSTNKKKMPPGVPDIHGAPDPIVDSETTKGESYFSKLRSSRQSFRNNQSNESGRVDACESKVEIVTPYWASNSAGKVRAIVNTQHFEQAIHQEVCSSKTQTKRCSGECGCEQKYKWHRLLAYDPDNDCKGIFMDWFLFPSCCVCRCAPTFGDK